MSRLYDRVMAEKLQPPSWIVGTKSAAWWPENEQRLKWTLAHATVFKIDNIAQYFWEGNSQEEWNIERDFPNLAPPFDVMWMEYRLPQTSVNTKGVHQIEHRHRVGVLFVVSSDDETASGDSCRWQLEASYFAEYEKGHIVGPISYASAGVRADGTVIPDSSHNGVFTDETISADLRAKMLPGGLNVFLPHILAAMLSISFLHCRNVRVVENFADAKLAKASERRGRPLTKYYTLEIDPMKEVLRQEGQSEKHGLQRALHICRGHFATYTDDRPLFGRITGTFWKPAHVRGTLAAGKVVKDYAVKAVR